MTGGQRIMRAAMAVLMGAAMVILGAGCSTSETEGHSVPDSSVSLQAGSPATNFTLSPVQKVGVETVKEVAAQQDRPEEDAYAAVLAALTDTWLGERTSPGGPLIIRDSYEGTAESSVESFYARLDQARAQTPQAPVAQAVATAQGNPKGAITFEAMRPYADVALAG